MMALLSLQRQPSTHTDLASLSHTNSLNDLSSATGYVSSSSSGPNHSGLLHPPTALSRTASGERLTSERLGAGSKRARAATPDFGSSSRGSPIPRHGSNQALVGDEPRYFCR